MSEQDRAMCAQCGGPIPPRPDPRGQRARYCSGACRARASRERAAAKWRAEVEAEAEKARLATSRSAQISELEVAAMIEQNPKWLAEVVVRVRADRLRVALREAESVLAWKYEDPTQPVGNSPRPAGIGIIRPQKKNKKKKRRK